MVAAGFFLVLFCKSRKELIQKFDNTIVTIEERMVEKYNIGQFGSDHAHAAMVMFVESERATGSLWDRFTC